MAQDKYIFSVKALVTCEKLEILSLSIRIVKPLMVLHISIVHTFLLLNTDSLYGYITFCLSIHKLMNL